jgi:hypothetical protein
MQERTFRFGTKVERRGVYQPKREIVDSKHIIVICYRKIFDSIDLSVQLPGHDAYEPCFHGYVHISGIDLLVTQR